MHFSLNISIFGPNNQYTTMEGILQNKLTYETPEVQVVNLTEENSILAVSDYWVEPLD